MGRPRKNAVADTKKENEQAVGQEAEMQAAQIDEIAQVEVILEEAPVQKKTRARTKKVEKEVVKEEEKKPVKKNLTVMVSVQFSGKSYSQDDLVKIAKDIWKYDYKRKAKDFEKVEFYVKPEDKIVYYVINNEVEGSFAI